MVGWRIWLAVGGLAGKSGENNCAEITEAHMSNESITSKYGKSAECSKSSNSGGGKTTPRKTLCTVSASLQQTGTID